MDISKLHFAVLATDVLLFSVAEGKLLVRLIEINRPPYYEKIKGLPGGLLNPDETALQAAERHLKEKAKIFTSSTFYLEQLYTFSDIDRDPRGRVVSVAYWGAVSWENLSETERNSCSETAWVEVDSIDKLAFDHEKILQVGLTRLRSKIKYTTLISKLLPKKFTLTELMNLYELIWKQKLDKRNFRKKIMQLKVLKALGQKRTGIKSRPAELYCFKTDQVVDLSLVSDLKI